MKKSLIAILALAVTLVIVNYLRPKQPEFVVYKVGVVDGHETSFMAFSKEPLSPEFVVEEIIDKKNYSESTKKFTGLKNEIGVDSGYVWHVSFLTRDTTYHVDINRVGSNDIKSGTVLSIPNIDSIPMHWFGWWGDCFKGNVSKEYNL